MPYSYQKFCDTVPGNIARFVFKFFYENIRKVALKYETFLCFFYMNIIVCRKKYWKGIRNIRFYNSCFKFGCGNRVDENVIYSCCSVFSNACQLIYNWHHQAMAKHNIKKILYFFILFEIKQVYIEIASHYHILLRTSLVYSISFKRFSNSFTSTFGGLYVKLRIMFFDF